MKIKTQILCFCALVAWFSIIGTVQAETVLWSDNFDDGNGDNRWYADLGLWQIGSPTVGPQTNAAGSRAHSGALCATTGLSGNYLSGQDSRFIRIASFTVPATNQNPRLRFWHWFSFAGRYCSSSYPYPCDEGSYGYVEIKVGTNDWQQVSPQYVGSGSGVWSRPSIDLTAYAGESVQIAFHFHSAAYADVGWYLDDVAVVTGAPVLDSPEGFELGLGDWYPESGTWEVGVPKSGPPTNSPGRRAYGGTNCAATVLAGNYARSVDSRFVSPPFGVPAASASPRLSFWHWYSFAGAYCSSSYPYPCDEGSYGYVEIRVGTNNWQTVSPTYSDSSSGVWTKPSIDLMPYAGQTNVQIAFHFHSAAYSDVGWYVDDVAVVTGPLVLSNPDGFELGIRDWSVESGTWEVGVPTGGPPTNAVGWRAYSGTNCAATVLAGNYARSVDSRFVSPPFGVPAASASPRLSFWHWYSFAGAYCSSSYPYPCDEGSYGYVEIRVGTNNWQTVSPTYSDSSSGVWTKPSIDLTPYGGQTNVQIAFHFHSAAYSDVGWYVDDVAVVTGPPVLSNPDGFELGIRDWSAESGTWEVGVPAGGPPTNAVGWRAYSGTNCAATVLAGNYASSVDSRLVSPAFLVPLQSTGPALRFRHWYNFAGPYCSPSYPYPCDEGSYGYVEIKAGTNNWQTVSPQYTGQSGAWTLPFIDLGPFGGQTVQVAFHFHSAANTALGWYVDDVRLIHDFGLLLLDSPIVRTQDAACFSLGIAISSPASAVSFTLQAPVDNLSNLTLNTDGCWSGAITPQPSLQWLVTLQNSLQNSCTNAPLGVQTIGSICFTAISTESAFVPLSVDNLVVTNPDGSLPPTHALGSRTVIIANKPLLEPWVGLDGQRMLTTFGKANTAYVIHQSTNATAVRPWLLGWTNTVPASLFANSPVKGPLSNAPVLFLDAREQ